MNCEQVRDLLSAYLDDQLTADERQRVSAHLPSCPQCAGILADYRRFDALLAQLPRVTPTPDLRNRILATTGPFISDGQQKSPDAHSHSLHYTPLFLPIRNFFPKQQTIDNTQTLSKSSSFPQPSQPLLNHYPRRNTFGLQLTLILILVLLTYGIRLFFVHYSWQKRS
ncbi:anti-sigma factor family protein [Dictyobacter formicarum]|uniref:Putative zinc-finger domain-containing protein n=1 Tax=Dictyobacter formicarum TaxID=2778368 RepID=A0ABQ3VFM6_9CHLR|nr:zf-HC2 domain-containing protein [Dictyobacter formicarum]GHO84585.1 hypothetical protein KSZ_25910 [Dictyobacter formicarum]